MAFSPGRDSIFRIWAVRAWPLAVLLTLAEPAAASTEQAREALKVGDYAKAVAELEAAIAAGDQEAANILGEMYHVGHGVAPDPRRSCDLFEIAARAHVGTAQHNLANCYFHGRGRPVDYRLSRHWYEQAIDSGVTRALCALGNQYLAGQGVPKDKEKAFRLCYQAANAGEPGAQTDIGQMYLRGVGVGRNYAEAARWFSKAAKQDHANAARLLGLMYFRGDGVARSNDKARVWLSTGARLGHPAAYYPLGELYLGLAFDGRRSKLDPKTGVTALFWFRLAAEDDPSAELRAKAKNRYAALSTMAPELLDQVEQMIGRWRGSNMSKPRQGGS